MKFLCQFGLNPSSGSGDIVQTKSYADADADGIHTKNNMSPTPSEGGHNKNAKESLNLEETVFKIPYVNFKPFINEYISDKWQTIWNGADCIVFELLAFDGK